MHDILIQMDSLRRPKPGETEEDLLRMQEEFRKSVALKKVQPISASVQKMTRKTNSVLKAAKEDPLLETTAKKKKSEKFERGKKAGHFCLNLDVLQEECDAKVFFDVQERNTYLFDKGVNHVPLHSVDPGETYARDDGFPEVIDLSRYFLPDGTGKVHLPVEDGRSLFALEFDRLGGKIEDTDYGMPPSTSDEAAGSSGSDSFDDENKRRIAQMTPLEIEEAQREIVERFDPKFVEMLCSRYKQKMNRLEDKAQPRESVFKKARSFGRDAEKVSEGGSKSDAVEADEMIKQLEFFKAPKNVELNASSELPEANAFEYTRLATDAAQLDFATKCLRSIVPRRQHNVARLFDGLEMGPRHGKGDELVEEARRNLPAIKGLFLEERETGEHKKVYFLASDVNPFTDGSWTLYPVRKVLDVCQADGSVRAEDVVVVRLSLLWTVLLMTERASVFLAFSSPKDFYVRLAEIFLIGPEVFMDDCVSKCAERILLKYLVPKAKDGLFSPQLTEPVADLDAFMPFYDDLLRRFEEHSVSDVIFSLMILVGAYMNGNLSDALLTQCALWGTDRKVVRQMTVDTSRGAFVLEYLKRSREEDCDELEDEQYVQYAQLLAKYAAAIRDEVVTRERNPLVFEIAAYEIGKFVSRHSARASGGEHYMQPEKMKEFDVLVNILRSVVAKHLYL